MKIDSNIWATEKELTERGISLGKLTGDLTLPNPAYSNAVRFRKGKYFTKIPKFICYLKKVGEQYVVPRYYEGIPMFEGNMGRKIHSQHFITLRKYQQEFFDENLGKITDTSGILLEAPCGHGKCHGKGTKILMYDGSIKNVEDIVVGDLLMGDDSTPRKVLSLARGTEELFVVHQNKGKDYVVNRSHILTLQYRPYGRGTDKSRFGEVVDMPLTEYLSLPDYQKKYYYGFCVPIEFPHKDVLIDPYFLGVWLGDGTENSPSVTCDHRDRRIVRFLREYAEGHNLHLRVAHSKSCSPKYRRNNANTYYFVGNERGKNSLLNQLRELGVFGNKHIPDNYIVNSRESRLQLLAGLIDTDGSYSNHVLEITQKRKNLAEDIRRLCWSLGYRVSMKERIIDGRSYWRLIISGNIHEIPTRLKRKHIPQRRINKDPFVNSIKVESIGVGDYYGFTLDGNNRYCLVDSTVTHNTLMAIWLAYLRGVQTMILVPTYYLARQWEGVISHFTDGSYCVVTSKDTEIPTDRDFTIIVMDLFTCRVLPKELVKNVGHVILDEAHRMGADKYIPILDEIPAMFRTALTATFRRADGVHRILQYHFGEHIKMPNRFPKPDVYGVKTSCEVMGVVSKNKGYEYFLSFMEDYYEGKLKETKSTIAFDSKQSSKLRTIAQKLVLKGKVKKTAYRQICACLKRGEDMAYPTVESHLNENSARMKEVIRLIQGCMDAGRTVLFLSKRKDTLRALYKYFNKYKPMLIVSETNARSEEDELYLQTKCRLIFGVNQLAKEGLDIDRLDTLIIHLPMADTEQAIGRISRLCEGKKQPIAFYLVDRCPLTYATYSKAKKMFEVNGNFKGEVTVNNIKSLL